jgi:hypothetical protein
MQETPTPIASEAPPTEPVEERADGLTADQAASLGSLIKVDDHPLYTMRYTGIYESAARAGENGNLGQAAVETSREWACSLFATAEIYGRNFDWEHSPALLLFTDPTEGYASVSMVDIAYLGFDPEDLNRLTELELSARKNLLAAPRLPFDGMNEAGVAIGMAAVPPGGMTPDPDKESIGSLGVIRQILDRAGNVDEAVAILESYNIEFGGGPPIHYLVADARGRSALVEFYQGQMHIVYNTRSWHLATNFLVASASGSPTGRCQRYDTILEHLTAAEGDLDHLDGMELLAQVSQSNTEWSVVYGMQSGEVIVSMGRAYDSRHTFPFEVIRR